MIELMCHVCLMCQCVIGGCGCVWVIVLLVSYIGVRVWELVIVGVYIGIYWG